ncbi:hypothetical protein [Cohnella sp. GCM10012308]|uniref:hypothetical protein n=1 Tax=Cohnella sp. GCM10012308 TaxID=3317329 RepID=UPI00360C2FCF
MIQGSEKDLSYLIKKYKNAVDEWNRTEQSIKDRITDRRESMTKFGSEDYYRNQIAMEEELLSKIQDIRKSDEAFLVKLKESYNQQYGKS